MGNSLSRVGKQEPGMGPACPGLPQVEACKLGWGLTSGAVSWEWFTQDLPPLRIAS